jgi:hypothetical protein
MPDRMDSEITPSPTIRKASKQPWQSAIDLEHFWNLGLMRFVETTVQTE